jgi:phage gp36-like protein
VSAYCSRADLVRRFGAQELGWLTDETSGKDPDDTEIAEACDSASQRIDSYLLLRYTVPLASVPATIKDAACVLARKILLKDRAGPGSVAQQDYVDAVKWLGDVSDGKALLPDAAGVIEPASTATSIAVRAPAVVFTDDLLFGYMT